MSFKIQYNRVAQPAVISNSAYLILSHLLNLFVSGSFIVATLVDSEQGVQSHLKNNGGGHDAVPGYNFVPGVLLSSLWESNIK